MSIQEHLLERFAREMVDLVQRQLDLPLTTIRITY